MGEHEFFDDCLDLWETYRRDEIQMAVFGDRLGDAWGVVGSRARRILVMVRVTLRLRARELLEEVMD